MYRHIAMGLALTVGLTMPVYAQDSGSQNKNVDVHIPSADLHIGDDADAKKIGVPLYPGAKLKSGDENNNQANLSLLTETFGMKLIVANYVSGDAPAKVLDFYRDKLKKYGRVLECHSQKHGGDVDVHDDDKDSSKSKELKCDENSGPVTELKVGTEENQRIVAVEPGDGNKGSNIALVYVYTRGKRGDI